MSRTWVARLWPAALFQFCFVGGMAMLKPGANALVLARYQASALPWLYLGAAVLTGGLAVWTAVVSLRKSPAWVLGVGAASTVAFTAAVVLGLPATPLVAYLFAEALGTQVALSFWGAVGDAFDARQARRAFSLINGLGMTGAIFGGFLAQVLARTASASALLGGAAALFTVGVVAWRFHRVESAEGGESAPRAVVQGSWREAMAVPYARLLGGVVVGLSLLTVLTDYAFRHRAAAQLEEANMADLFGSNQLWTGVFCVVFQLLVAEQLLRRLGILRYVALVPLVTAAMAVVAVVVPSVWATWALKLFENAVSWSLMPVALQLLYAPIPDHSRDRIRRTIDGFVRKGGLALGGVVLIGAAQVLGDRGVLVATVVVCLGVVALLWRLRPRYLQAVNERVAGARPEAMGVSEARMLHEAVKGGAADRSLRAAELLEHSGLLTEPDVKALLQHPHERAQERGAHLAEAHRFTGLSRELEAVVALGARRPRDAGLWALGKLNPERAVALLPTLLSSTDIGVLCAAVGGLLRTPNDEQDQAWEVLSALLLRWPTAAAPERREVARLLGRLGRPELSQALNRALEDADSSVRRVAIHAVGAGSHLELAPRLLRFLAWRDERRHARAALTALGDAVVPLLAQTLDDRTKTLGLRLQLPRVLRHIGTQAAFDVLLFSNMADEPALHHRVGVSLAHLKEEQPGLTVDTARVRAAIGRREQVLLALKGPYLSAKKALPADALLTRVLGDRLDQSFELVFWLLGLLYEPRALRRAHAQLLGGDARRRAWALELVDTQLAEPERSVVRTMIREHHRAASAEDAEGLRRHLDTLCRMDDFVVRAVARQAARAEGTWTSVLKEDDMSDVTLKRLFALEGVDIFAQSDVDDLAAVAAVAREQRFRAGERIYGEGDPGDALYVVVEGSAEARRDGEALLRIGARESFGETSLFDGAPRVNDVVALEDTSCLLIDRRDFLDLLSERPELLSGMFRVLSRQLKSVVVGWSNRRQTDSELPAVR